MLHNVLSLSGMTIELTFIKTLSLKLKRDVRLKLGLYKLVKLQRVRTVAIEPATDGVS